MSETTPPRLEKGKDKKQDKKKDKYILFAFLAFFGVVFTVDAIFIHTALTTYTGVVTDKAYERGLNYNDTLNEANTQPELNDQVSFENGVLRWNLGIEKAVVNARIIRPIQEGHDFDIVLNPVESGVYEAALNFPFKGLWEAKLSGKWNNKTYKTTYQFIVK